MKIICQGEIWQQNLFENEALKSEETLKMKGKGIEIYLKIKFWKVIYKNGIWKKKRFLKSE